MLLKETRPIYGKQEAAKYQEIRPESLSSAGGKTASNQLENVFFAVFLWWIWNDLLSIGGGVTSILGVTDPHPRGLYA